MFYLVVFLVAVITAIRAASPAIDNDHYTLWTLPETPTDISVSDTLPGSALIGGGRDCVPAFEYMINHANGGDFVVLSASGADGYNYNIMGYARAINKPLNSITTIKFKDRDAAYDPIVQSKLRNAEAIFFSGGDQSLYLKYWKGTPVQDIIQAKLVNTTIGGTSAGLAIQGNWVYSADTGSAYSDESMLNPYNKFVTLQTDFLKIPFLQEFITDTHFSVRDRMGRMLSFVSRIMTDYEAPKVHAVGIDETTALLLDVQTGSVRAVGEGNAYICSATQPPSVCLPDTELTLQQVACTRMAGRGQQQYDFQTMSGDGVQYYIDIVQGKYTTSTLPYGPQA
jgi:cyanophycinase